jgi:protein TonB
MKKKQAIFNAPEPLSNNDSLLICLFFATVIHIVIGLAVNFKMPEPDEVSRSIDIILVDTPSQTVPDKAQALAQENQLGAGEQNRKQEQQAQPLVQGGNRIKQLKKSEPEQSKPKAEKKIVTREKSEKKIATENKPDTGRQTEKRPQLTPEMLQQQIAQLGAEIRLSQQSSEQAKIKFADSVSAHKYVAAQYIKDWEDKVERTGNLNYPEVAAKKNFSGTLTMDVGIKADGSIYSIRISQSSGNPALDEAAKKIVRMSAPFAPLPVDLRKELDVLVITRVWKFSDESGMTTR